MHSRNLFLEHPELERFERLIQLLELHLWVGDGDVDGVVVAMVVGVGSTCCDGRGGGLKVMVAFWVLLFRYAYHYSYYYHHHYQCRCVCENMSDRQTDLVVVCVFIKHGSLIQIIVPRGFFKR